MAVRYNLLYRLGNRYVNTGLHLVLYPRMLLYMNDDVSSDQQSLSVLGWRYFQSILHASALVPLRRGECACDGLP